MQIQAQKTYTLTLSENELVKIEQFLDSVMSDLIVVPDEVKELHSVLQQQYIPF